MKFLIISALILLPGIEAAVANDCANAQSQMQLNTCSGENFDRADAELNKVWSKIQRGYTAQAYDQRRKAALLASQRAWLAYRNAECEGSVGLDWEGGSGRRMAENICATELTLQRTQRLKTRVGSD